MWIGGCPPIPWLLHHLLHRLPAKPIDFAALPSSVVGIALLVTTDLKLIDNSWHQNVLVRIAVQVCDYWSRIDAGRHFCRPFELDVLRA